MSEISITVKTLDSVNRTYRVAPTLAVKEFKELISVDVRISAETQRLIYCGRVLQDDKQLSEYDLDGKAVHLVQRAPPSATAQQPRAPAPSAAREARRPPPHMHIHQFRHRFQGAPNLADSFPVGPSSLLRLNTARRMLENASNSLSRVSGTVPSSEPEPSITHEPEMNLNPGTTVTMDMTVEGSFPVNVDLPVAQAATAAAIAAAFSAAQALGVHPPGGAPGDQRPQPEAPTAPADQTPTPAAAAAPTENQGPAAANNRPQQSRPETRNPRVSVFADVIEDVERIQNDLRPHLTSVRQLLRDDPNFGEDREAARRAQHTFNRVSESLHFLAHAYHAISDLFVDWSQTPAREVRARPLVLQQTAVLSANIPVTAAFGDVEDLRSRLQQQQQQQQQPPPQEPAQPQQPQQQPQQQAQQQSGATRQPSGPQPVPSPFGRVMMNPPLIRSLGPMPMPRMTVHGGSGGNIATGVHVSPVMYMELRPQDGADISAMPFPPPMPQSSQFDPLLPCSSRHLPSASREQQPRAAQPQSAPAAAATAGGAAPASGPTPAPAAANQRQNQQGGFPGGGSFAEFLMQQTLQQQAQRLGEQRSQDSDLLQNMFRSMSSEVSNVFSGRQPGRSVGEFVRTLSEGTPETGESIIMDLFLTAMDHVSFADLISIFFGQTSGLNNLQPVMLDFIRTRIMGGGDFSELSIRAAVARLVDEVIPHLQNLSSEANVVEDVHFVATVAHFLEQQFHDIIQLIAVPGENPNFGSLLMSRLSQLFQNIVGLILLCLTDGNSGLERIFSAQIRSFTEGTSNPLLQQMTQQMALDRLRQLVARLDLNQLRPTLSPFIFNRSRGEAWLSQRASRNEPAAPRPAEPSQTEAAAGVTSVDEHQPMEVDVPQAAEVPSRLERLRRQAAGTTTAADEQEAAPPVVVGSQQWHNAVPQDWIPNITVDIQRQNRQGSKQAPFSDAYLSSIPPKRRKMIVDGRPPSNPGQLVQDTLHRALQLASVTPAAAPEEIARVARESDEVLSALRAAARPLGRRRLENDPDNDAELFPNANRYFGADE